MEKETDLISRSRLLRDPYFIEDRFPESHLLRMAIREQRAVPAVRVVRCAECKHYVCDELGNYCGYHTANCAPGGFVEGFAYMNPDDFCSKGERKQPME